MPEPIRPFGRPWKLVHFHPIGIEPPSLSADTDRGEAMPTDLTGHDMRDGRLTDIQQRIGRGEYRVDTQAVASAILRRLLAGGEPPGGRPPQEPCS